MRRLIASILVLLVLINISVWAQEKEENTKFKSLYREGIELVKSGHYQDAYVSFEKALQLSPSSDLIRYMIQETGDLILQEMLTQPDLHQTALRILELGKGAYQRLVRSPEEIQKIVAQLDGPFDKKWEAINMLSAIGQRATPFLIEQLANPSETIRANTMHALEKIGNEAVFPLIESLQSKALLVKQNAVIILGVIRDERAIPALKQICEDDEEVPDVKRYAVESLKKITKTSVDKLKPAKEYYFTLAEKFYYSHPSVMINFYGDYVIWRWDVASNSLKMKEVPDFTFNDLLAEEYCYNGLKLDENYEPSWSLLVCALLSQYNKSDIALQTALRKNKSGEITQEVLTKLQSDLSKIKENLTAGSLAGKTYFYKALQRSLTDNNADVAVSCIQFLKDSADFTDLPTGSKNVSMGSPLIEALSHSDKRIRYAAAEALLKMNPPQSFQDMGKVIPIINEALGESGVRVVLLIEPGSKIRSYLKTELTKLNCFTIETLNAQDGINSAKRFPTEDLIILNNKLANEVVFTVDILGKKYSETVFDSLKEDIRTKGISIVMIGSNEEIEKAKSIYQDKVDNYLVIPTDNAVLSDIINKIFQKEETQNDSKARALQVCANAARILANLDISRTNYPYNQTVDGLVGVLENRPDDIRLSALQALSRFANPAALPGLYKTLGNKENPLLIRVKTAETISSIFRNKPESITRESYDILKKSLMEDEPEVKQVIASALGNAKLTLTQRKELFQMKRPVLPGE
jgi:HEAT repeat protein